LSHERIGIFDPRYTRSATEDGFAYHGSVTFDAIHIFPKGGGDLLHRGTKQQHRQGTAMQTQWQ